MVGPMRLKCQGTAHQVCVHATQLPYSLKGPFPGVTLYTIALHKGKQKIIIGRVNILQIINTSSNYRINTEDS